MLDRPGTFDLHDCVAAVVEMRGIPSDGNREIFEQEGESSICIQCRRKEPQVNMKIHIQSQSVLFQLFDITVNRTDSWLSIVPG